MELVSILLNNRVIFEAIQIVNCDSLIIVKNEAATTKLSTLSIVNGFCKERLTVFVNDIQSELPNCKIYHKNIPLSEISVFNLIQNY